MSRSRRFIFVAILLVCLFVCCVNYVNMIPLPEIDAQSIAAAEQTAQEHYEGYTDNDFCISMEVLTAEYNEKETLRIREMYQGFKDGWTERYLAENLIVIRVVYLCEFDHQKTWIPDGKITTDVYLTRTSSDVAWEYWDCMSYGELSE